MKNRESILITGGSGLLGRELRKLLPWSLSPTHADLDISNAEALSNFLKENRIDLIIHCAGYMPASQCEDYPDEAIRTNIIGTALIAVECIKRNIKLIYISTDYVFKGDKGNYKETDELLPINKYAWSKLGGECAVKMHSKGLIIRTSFGPRPYPYDRAFANQWTSKQPVDIIAKKIANLIDKDVYGIIHLGGDRKTVYEYAKELSPEKEIRMSSIPKEDYTRPVDTSLDTSKYKLITSK